MISPAIVALLPPRPMEKRAALCGKVPTGIHCTTREVLLECRRPTRAALQDPCLPANMPRFVHGERPGLISGMSQLAPRPIHDGLSRISLTALDDRAWCITSACCGLTGLNAPASSASRLLPRPDRLGACAPGSQGVRCQDKSRRGWSGYSEKRRTG
eukprot:scaffold153984_cov31-Tisochrysis_lutea.AAC.2